VASGTGTSVLDLTFSSPELTDQATNWAIDHEAFAGSDHESIRFELKSTRTLLSDTPTSPQRFNWDKADWDGFLKHLTDSSKTTEHQWRALHDNPTTDNMDKAAEMLRNLILEAIRQHVPTSNICDRSKRWWNPTILKARQTMRTTLKRWKETRAPQDHTTYKATRNEYFRGIKTAKAETWKSFLADAVGKDIYQAMKYTKPRKTQSTPNITVSNATATTFDSKAQLFRKAMFPPPPTDNSPTPPAPKHPLQWTTFTPTEIQKAINTSAPRKAPGPDGIPFLCLQKSYNAIPQHFNSLYATLGQKGYHPKCWRQAVTVVIPKPNKPDYSSPKAYRPVALLNCLGKTLEKLMASRLAYMAEEHHLLHKDQIGGRPQRSAIDGALALTHEIDSARNRKEVTSTLFMDVRGAFDNVSRTRLIKTMRHMGIPPPVLK
jgi:hypothetical protein